MRHRSTFLLVACAATLALAGCTTSDDQPNASTIPGAAATVAPGTTAHLPLFLEEAGGDVADVTAAVRESAGLNVTVPDAFTAENGTLAAWVGFAVPADATPGEHEVVVGVTDGDAGTRNVAFTITVAEASPSLTEGKVALTDVTARTRDGAIAFTTVEALATGPLPHADGYEAAQEYGPMPITLSPQSRMPPALAEALAASAVGHSFSVEVPDAFGPASKDSEKPRVEQVERVREEQRVYELPRGGLESQGLIDNDTREGDTLDVPGPLPYVVDFLNETHVRIVLDLAEGDTLTLHAAWPDATDVATVTNETVTLRTTPPVDAGERFTWREAWPDATEIVDANEKMIVLQHSPELGLTYTDTSPQGQPVELTVKALKEDVIVVSQANPHPLGGETLVFEITVVEEQDAPAPPPAPSR